MGDLGTLHGLNIYHAPTMVIGPFEDWSMVRSPSRARRRRRYRQNIRLYYLPDPNLMRAGNSLCGHPETIRKLMDRLAQEQSHER